MLNCSCCDAVVAIGVDVGVIDGCPTYGCVAQATKNSRANTMIDPMIRALRSKLVHLIPCPLAGNGGIVFMDVEFTLLGLIVKS